MNDTTDAPDAPRAPNARGRFDSWIVGGLSLVVCMALAQDTLYGVDAWNDLRGLMHGDSRSATHVLYKPLVAWFAAGLDVVGLTLHESVRAASAVGTALGVAWMHAASRRLGASRIAAFLAAVWITCLPGVVFYGTVAERHGVFLAFAGVACYAAARASVRAGVVAPAVLGLTIGLAYAAHSTGVLLTAMLVPVVVAERRVRGLPWRRAATTALVAAAAATFAASKLGVWLGQVTVEGGNLKIFGEWASVAVDHLGSIPNVAWQEFLLPLVPVSFLWVWRLRRPGDGGRLAAIACGASVYLVFAFLVLGGFDAIEQFDERGAYLLPLAWPLAHYTAAWMPRGVVLVGIAVSLTVAIGQVRIHDVRPHASLASALRASAVPADPYLLPACRADFEMLFAEFPELERWTPDAPGDFLDLFIAVHGDDLEKGRAVAALVPVVLRGVIDSGRPVYLTDAAVAALEAPEQTNERVLAPVLLAEIRAAFALEPVVTGASELRPR